MTARAVAILDDYQGVALDVADWSALDGRLTVSAFTDHLADIDELVDRLAPFRRGRDARAHFVPT